MIRDCRFQMKSETEEPSPVFFFGFRAFGIASGFAIRISDLRAIQRIGTSRLQRAGIFLVASVMVTVFTANNASADERFQDEQLQIGERLKAADFCGR